MTTDETDLTAAYRTTYHRDGTVTIWHVYRQQWVRLSAGSVSDEVLATLSDAERRRIARMTEARR